MPELVTILDVVVDQRVVVKDFDCDRRIERVFERRALAGGDAQHHLRAQPFAPPGRTVSSVTEMTQKHIGDLARSPIPDNSFFERAFKTLKRVDD